MDNSRTRLSCCDLSFVNSVNAIMDDDNMNEDKDIQEALKLLDEIIAKAKQNGGLMVIGSNQCGKTYATMWLLRRIRESEEHLKGEAKVTIFDTVFNWRYKFDSIGFIEFGIEELQILPVLQDLLIDVIDSDPAFIKQDIARILQTDFDEKRELKKKFEGVNTFTNYYVIEEVQNVFGRSGLQGESGRHLRKIFTESPNFGMCIIGVGQRLADIDTTLVERRRYFLFGRMNGENDLRKIVAMFGRKFGEEVVKGIRGCGQQQFIWFDSQTGRVEKVDIPDWKPEGKPLRFVNEKKHGWRITLYRGIE